MTYHSFKDIQILQIRMSLKPVVKGVVHATMDIFACRKKNVRLAHLENVCNMLNMTMLKDLHTLRLKFVGCV